MKLSTLLKLEYINPKQQNGLQQRGTSPNPNFMGKKLSTGFSRKLSYVLFASLQAEKEIYYLFKPSKTKKHFRRETSREISEVSSEMVVIGQSPNNSAFQIKNKSYREYSPFKMQQSEDETFQFFSQILKNQQIKREKLEKQWKQTKYLINDQSDESLQVSGQRSQLNQFTDLISSFRARLEKLKQIESERKKFKKYTNTNNLNDSESDTNYMSTSRNEKFFNEIPSTRRKSLLLSSDRLNQINQGENSPSKRRILDLKKLIETQIMQKKEDAEEQQPKSKWGAIKASFLKKMSNPNQQQKDEEIDKLEKLTSLGSKFTQRLSKIDEDSLNKVKKLFLKNQSLLKFSDQQRDMEVIYEKKAKTDRDNLKDNNDADSPRKEGVKSKMIMKRLLREQKLKEMIEIKKKQNQDDKLERIQPEEPVVPLIPKRKILTKEQIKELLRPSKSALLMKLGFDLGNMDKKSQNLKGKKKLDRRQSKFQPQTIEKQQTSMNDLNEVDLTQKPKIEMNQKELKQLASEFNRPLHEIKIQNQILIQALSEQTVQLDEKSKKHLKKYREQIDKIEKQKEQAYLKIRTTNADIYNDQAKELFKGKLKMYDFEQRGLKFMDNVGYKTVQKQHQSKNHEDIPLYGTIFQTKHETDQRREIFQQQWREFQKLKIPDGLKQCSLEEDFRKNQEEQIYLLTNENNSSMDLDSSKRDSEVKEINELEQIYFCLAQKLRPRRKITKIEKARFKINQMNIQQKKQLWNQMVQIQKNVQEKEKNKIFQDISLRLLDRN